ncbi:MAG: hypothetical protein JNJ46_30755 [Myxococcales bacterium]|nr:hypothetical protein [Myxococcales bacterium]
MRACSFVSAFVFASAVSTSLIGCQSGSASMMSGTPESRFCEYSDFSVDITSGPSAGLHLAGTLHLEESLRTGGLTGSLQPTSGTAIPVTGAVYKSGDIALTFHTKSGYVMGLGKLGDNFCKPGARIEGVAIGPRVATDNRIGQSDTGHWVLLGANLILEPVMIQIQLTEPADPSQITFSNFGSQTFNAVTCVEGAKPVSENCCKAMVGGGGSTTTCQSGGVTCSFTRSNNFSTVDRCCDGAKSDPSVPDCAGGISQIKS